MSGTLHDAVYVGPSSSSSASTSHQYTSPVVYHDGNKRKELEDDDDSSEGKKRKHKFTRSRTACHQCRSRKSKCGAMPPDPCSNCIEAGIGCTWPAEDGRSSRARMERKARLSSNPAHASSSTMGDVKPTIPIQQRHASHSSNGGANQQSTGAEDGESVWLDQLLSSGMMPPRQDALDPFPPPPPLNHHPSSGGTIDIASSIAATTTIPNTAQPMFPPPFPSMSQPMPGQQILPNNGFAPSSMDPAQFIWAVSSRLPTVEESSPFDMHSTGSGPSPKVIGGKKLHRDEEGKIVKVTWWRPHGQTAIAPGLKRITLKVRVDSPQNQLFNYSPRPVGSAEATTEVIAPDGAPNTTIMRHLLDVFMVHFGCQYPFLDRSTLDGKIESRMGSVFLLNSIAAIAARFSSHPAIALPDLKPYDYGNVFYSRAKAMLGSMLAVPSRETVAAFILLASCGFANDSESEVWMMTGLAVRMSIDLGLHLDPPESSNISPEDRRLNRLVFWSVLLMDHALAFGVGRSTTYRVEEITQPMPTEEDVHPTSPNTPADPSAPRSPFPFCAQMMISYGPLINMLNMGDASLERHIADARSASIREYNRLPPDMQWNVANLQRHSRGNQASAFLHLHLWMHTILASGYLTGSNILRRGGQRPSEGPLGAATPNQTASNLWRNSARTIGDILVLSDIICPLAYCALPFVNQAFFVAGCCYVKELETTKSAAPSPAASPRRVPAGLHMTTMEAAEPSTAISSPTPHGTVPDGMPRPGHNVDKDGRNVDLSRALLASVASTNISTLQQGLERQNVYWQGTAWISSALKQRVEGMQEVDLVGVTEKLASSVSLPDAGLVGRKAVEGEEEGATNHGIGGVMGATGFTPGIDWMTFTPGPGSVDPSTSIGFGDMDFLSSLPFDMGHTDSSQNVIEQDVPLPQVFDPQWFK